ncbi:SMC-Scp complex subunit ScpB [Aliihoeflea sp. PC F10.4]
MDRTAGKVIAFSGQAGAKSPDSDLFQTIRIVEALIFASSEPVSMRHLKEKLPQETDVTLVLAELQKLYAMRGVNLVRIGEGWAFRTAADLSFILARDEVRERKLSRAALEVLAIIAYHQPVTRAEMEDIRGVETAKGTLDTLLETGWVRMRGRRKTPGRPVTYGTTDAFLDHFGLAEIRDMPGMDELRGAGLLSARLPADLQVPTPPADPGFYADDEEPLSDIDLEELGLLTPKVEDD